MMRPVYSPYYVIQDRHMKRTRCMPSQWRTI